MIGKRIKKLRNEKKYTQTELANKLGTKQQTISQYEKDKRQPDCEMTKKIANLFEVSIDYLYGATTDPTPVNKISENISNNLDLIELRNLLKEREDLRSLLRLAKGMTPENVRRLIRVNKAIVHEDRECYDDNQ